MYPPDCDYYRAGDVNEALDLLADHAAADPALFAGGQGLVTDMKTGEAAPGVLVDISGIDRLRGIEAVDTGVTVGALTRHADLAVSGTLRERVPVLARAADHVADRQVRNRGTLGGNLAEADPAADLPAAVLAADATLVLEGQGGERTVDTREFFEGDGATALDDREVLTAVRLAPADGSAYVRKTHPATGYAAVGVAAAVEVADGGVTDARVAVTGVTDRARRLRSVEAALTDGDDVSRAAERATGDIDAERLLGDAHFSGDYRRRVLPTYVERALDAAVDRAGGGAA